MRLNQKESRELLIEGLETIAHNVRHLPWEGKKELIHNYLLTIAYINALDPLAKHYDGISLDEYEVFKPIAELAVIPSKVTVVEDAEAVNLINKAKYEPATEYYCVYKVMRERDDKGQEQKKTVAENLPYRPMDVVEFNKFTRSLCTAFRAKTAANAKPITEFRKATTLSEVCRREVVNDGMIGLDKMPLWLNTTSFYTEAYTRTVSYVESTLIGRHLSKWSDEKNA